MIYINSLENIYPEMLQGFSVGWPTHPTPETHFKMLQNSYKVILAVEEGQNKVIGFISAISDGVLTAYIPLVEVLPQYQNLGIGKELVPRMLKELKDIYMVDLMCDENLQPYYEKVNMMRANGMIIRNYKMQAGK